MQLSKVIDSIGLTISPSAWNYRKKMDVDQEAAKKGQAVYSPRVLKIYDKWVLGFSNSLIWRCPTTKIRQLFTDHLSSNHLDIGVGTGYFLDKCATDPESRIGLVDMNENALKYASKRLARFNPETYKRNVTEPLLLACDNYDSVSINYLFHCLPGDIEIKGELFDEVNGYLNDDGVVFGATLLSQDIERPAAARMLMKYYNEKGIFSNEFDSLGDLMSAMSTRYRTFNVEVIGCAVLFWGKGPKRKV